MIGPMTPAQAASVMTELRSTSRATLAAMTSAQRVLYAQEYSRVWNISFNLTNPALN